MEFSCSNCLYSSNKKRGGPHLNCERIIPIQESNDDKVLEYILNTERDAYLAVSKDFLCNRWKPKEE